MLCCEQDWSEDPALFIGAVMKTFQAEVGNASLALWPSSPSYGWQSLRPLVPRNCSKASGTCEGIGHDLHYYMPKQEVCRVMATDQDHKMPLDFRDEDVNLVGEDGWGPSFPLIDSWAAVSPPGQLHLAHCSAPPLSCAASASGHPCPGLQTRGTGTGRKQRALLAAERPRQELARTHLGELPHYWWHLPAVTGSRAVPRGHHIRILSCRARPA